MYVAPRFEFIELDLSRVIVIELVEEIINILLGRLLFDSLLSEMIR